MIDARSGSDAVIYWESGPGGCTSGARVAARRRSGRRIGLGSLDARLADPDGYSGTIAATAFACDKVPNSVLVDGAGPNVAVVVTRPFGLCGTPDSISISLRAAVVTANLPGVIGHDPTGLLTGYSPEPSTPPGAASTTTTTTLPPPLVPVDISSSGKTLDVTVGEAVTINPLAAALGNPAVSSNPAVLGPLTSDPQPLVAEFRAWKPGTADITVPQSAGLDPGSKQFALHRFLRGL